MSQSSGERAAAMKIDTRWERFYDATKGGLANLTQDQINLFKDKIVDERAKEGGNASFMVKVLVEKIIAELYAGTLGTLPETIHGAISGVIAHGAQFGITAEEIRENLIEEIDFAIRTTVLKK